MTAIVFGLGAAVGFGCAIGLLVVLACKRNGG